MKALAILGISLIAMSGHAYGAAADSKADQRVMWSIVCLLEAVIGMFLIMTNHTHL